VIGRLGLLIVIVLGLAVSLPASAQAPGPEITSDCDGCPELVPMPDGSGDIGRFTVTRDQFAAFAEDTGFKQDGTCVTGFNGQWGNDPTATWENPGFEQQGNHPVVCVTWLDATAYVDWLSEKTGKSYRLPTLEESTAAASAGSDGPFPWGADEADICEHGNVADLAYAAGQPDDPAPNLACDDHYVFTSPVDAFPPNAAGIYDGIGNVWQWTNSCLQGDCSNAIFRGGGWNVPWIKSYQIGESFGDRILLRNFVIGFRVFRDPD
jgi:formylglycine-generating enzyme required for sulfatase activity